MKAIFSGKNQCVRTKMYSPFKLDNAKGDSVRDSVCHPPNQPTNQPTKLSVMVSEFICSGSEDYSGQETPSGERLHHGEEYCSDCHCCTACNLQCGICHETREDEELLPRVCHMLDINMDSEDFRWVNRQIKCATLRLLGSTVALHWSN